MQWAGSDIVVILHNYGICYSSMIARNEQTLQGFMTVFLEAERDDVDKREQNGQSIIEAYKSLQNLQLPGKSFSPGFK